MLGDTRGEVAWDPPEDNEEKEVEATRPLSLDLSSSSPSRGGVGGVVRTGLKAEASLSRPCRKRACWASRAAGYPSPGKMSGRKGAEADRSMLREVGEGGGVRAPGGGGAGEPTTAITGSWTLLNEKSATVQVYSLSRHPSPSLKSPASYWATAHNDPALPLLPARQVVPVGGAAGSLVAGRGGG